MKNILSIIIYLNLVFIRYLEKHSYDVYYSLSTKKWA